MFVCLFRTYQRIMRQKLGLLELVDEDRDTQLVADLLEVEPHPHSHSLACTL